MSKRNKKYFKTLLIILTFLIFNSQFLIATIRYVSKTGLSIPPYTSWETAADSIQECINVCVFGDTIYVANGVYEEQVFMIPGLTLAGSGADSCFIDTREFSTPTNFDAVEVVDDCRLEGFCILVSYWVSGQEYGGRGVGIYGNGVIEVQHNKIRYANAGIGTSNSSSIVKNNFITDIDVDGVVISGSVGPFNPLIENNVIYSNRWGVYIFYAPDNYPTIVNNLIFIEGDDLTSGGIAGTLSGSRVVKNNLIIINSIGNTKIGIALYDFPTLIDNDYIAGMQDVGIIGNNNVKIRNNVVKDGINGIETYSSSPALIQYNDSWNNQFNYVGFAPDSTNLSVDPMVVNEDSLDFHLQMFSPLIDAGDPTILDKDSSRSDIGLYGGPFGESYVYLDLPPRPPVNLTAEVDSFITLNWNKNTEADFCHYNLYRDTVMNFTIDSTKLVASITDSFYLHLIPANVESLYFKLTAVDNQDNESNPSEEVSVILVSAKGEWQTVNNYMLYQNYPNPFNPSTKISYRLKERGYVKLYVYDIKGELVSVLVNQTQEAGYYEVEFNVGQDSSPVLTSGVYIYQIMVRNEDELPVFSEIKKMLMIK
jgi:parallel beta-helix repeat protein